MPLSIKNSFWKMSWRRYKSVFDPKMFDPIISRRNWLTAVPGAIGVTAAVRLASAQEYRIAGSDLKLGIASYSFRKFDRPQAIQMAKDLGTPYLNIKDFHLKLDSTPE